MKHTWIIVVVACLLTSCAVKPKGPKYSEVNLSPKPNHGLIVMYRTNAMPYGNDIDVLLDGERVEVLRDNTFITVDVPIGKHTITSDWSALAGQHDSNIELDIVAGKTFYLMVTGEKTVSGYAVIPGVTGYVEFDSKSSTELVEPQQAITMIENCCVKFGIDSMKITKKKR